MRLISHIPFISFLIGLPFIVLTSFTLTGCNSKASPAPLIETTSKESSSLLVYGEVKVDDIKEFQIDFPAKVENVIAKEGTIVNKGDCLLTLSFEDYKLQIATLEKAIEGYSLEIKGLQGNANTATASLDALSKELALKKSYVSSGQDPDILPLENKLTTLISDLKEAQELYEAHKALLEVGGVSSQEVDESKLACDKLQEQISNTQTAITKSKEARNLEITALQSKLNAATLESSNIDTDKASKISTLQVELESNTLNLQNMKAKLAAPYLSGNKIIADNDNMLIYDITVASGSTTCGLGQTLFKLMDLNTLYVSVDLPEESLSSINVGDPAILKVADKNMDAPITGTISRISEYATEKDGDTVVEAYISITEGKAFLKPGLSIDAYIN